MFVLSATKLIASALCETYACNRSTMFCAADRCQVRQVDISELFVSNIVVAARKIQFIDIEMNVEYAGFDDVRSDKNQAN
jgi:hypothetical protein